MAGNRNGNDTSAQYEEYRFDAGIISVDGTEFVRGFGRDSTAERFFVQKPSALLEQYVDLCRDLKPATIVELGIFAGGSTALIALLAEPSRFVALELDEKPVVGLQQFIAQRGLTDVVRPYYGVDQSDQARLREVVDAEFGDSALDLVIDDASHLLEPTRASFDVLFPRLRPGGLFIVEDWNSHHLYAAGLRAALEVAPDRVEIEARWRKEAEISPDPPLSWFIVELIVARAARPPASRTCASARIGSRSAVTIPSSIAIRSRSLTAPWTISACSVAERARLGQDVRITQHALAPRPTVCARATRAPFDLPRTGFAAQLAHQLDDLTERGGAERLALRQQSTARVHRPRAAERDRAVGEETCLLARRAQAELVDTRAARVPRRCPGTRPRRCRRVRRPASSYASRRPRASTAG